MESGLFNTCCCCSYAHFVPEPFVNRGSWDPGGIGWLHSSQTCWHRSQAHTVDLNIVYSEQAMQCVHGTEYSRCEPGATWESAWSNASSHSYVKAALQPIFPEGYQM